MQQNRRVYLKFALPLCLFFAFLGYFPQLALMITKGADYQGGAAFFDIDEATYASYIQALIDGKPRKNNPYTGLETEPESLFSVQFTAAYSIALPARLLGISAETAFIALTFFAAFLTCLAVFHLLLRITNDPAIAAFGTLFVLVFGTLLAGQGITREIFRFGYATTFTPYLRRYVPALAIPVMYLIFSLVTSAANRKSEKSLIFNAAAVVVAFNFLLYSYFYLWSAVFAWIMIFAVSLFLFRREAISGTNIRYFAAVITGCIVSLIPYFLLVANIQTYVGVIALERTHKPIILHQTVIAGIFNLCLIVAAVYFNRLDIRSTVFPVIIAFALLPLAVFNQQVITGHSMQPFHYAYYVVNYTILVSFVLVVREVFGRQLESKSLRKWGAVFAVFVAAWGVAETAGATYRRHNQNILANDGRGVLKRLKVSSENTKPGIISDANLADILPLFIDRQSVWAFHFNAFSDVSPEQYRRRYFEQIYFMNTTPEVFDAGLRRCPRSAYCSDIFTWRLDRTKLINSHLPTSDEIESVLEAYRRFYNDFDAPDTPKPDLGFLIIRKSETYRLANIDKWYNRSEADQFGDFVLYHLSLR